MSIDIKRLDYERIHLLYSSMTNVLVGGLSIILGLGIITSHYLETDIALFWAGTTAALYIPRLLLARQYNRNIKAKNITSSNVLIWERYWIFGTMPVLLSFTSLLYYPFANVQLPIIALFLIVLASGSIMSYSSSLKSVVWAISAIYLPLCTRFFMEDGFIYTVLGLSFIICFIIFYGYAKTINRNLLENIRLKIENEQHAVMDPLTKLSNRRGLHLYLDKIIPNSIRCKESFGMVLFDIDHFKKYNDTHGHLAGDDLLINVSALIEKGARDGDLVVRQGGEEFLAVLQNIDITQLKEYADRTLKGIKHNSNVTISAGLAISAPDLSFDQMLKLCDDALYAAKHAGRDQYKLAAQS